MTNDERYKIIATVGPAKAAEYGVYSIAPDTNVLAWAYANSFQLVSSVRDDNGAIVNASIVWPDGVAGEFITDIASTDFPGAIDAWHASYYNKTITQPRVIRDVNGAVTSQPAITVTGGIE